MIKAGWLRQGNVFRVHPSIHVCCPPYYLRAGTGLLFAQWVSGTFRGRESPGKCRKELDGMDRKSGERGKNLLLPGYGPPQPSAFRVSLVE